MNLNITWDTLPDFGSNLPEIWKELAEYQKGSVLNQMAEGGNPAWERTKYNTIPRLYDYHASTVKSESGEDYMEVQFGGKPGSFLHQFGGAFVQYPTEKQRGFFWAMFYRTGDDKWKGMALASSLVINMPARPVGFTDGDVEFFTQKLMTLVRILDARESTFGQVPIT